MTKTYITITNIPVDAETLVSYRIIPNPDNAPHVYSCPGCGGDVCLLEKMWSCVAACGWGGVEHTGYKTRPATLEEQIKEALEFICQTTQGGCVLAAWREVGGTVGCDNNVFSRGGKTIMPIKYRNIIFFQGEEADEALAILNDYGEEAVIQHLRDFDYGEGEVKTGLGNGSSDTVYEEDGLVLVYNLRLNYIGLSKRIVEI